MGDANQPWHLAPDKEIYYPMTKLSSTAPITGLTFLSVLIFKAAAAAGRIYSTHQASSPNYWWSICATSCFSSWLHVAILTSARYQDYGSFRPFINLWRGVIFPRNIFSWAIYFNRNLILLLIKLMSKVCGKWLKSGNICRRQKCLNAAGSLSATNTAARVYVFRI